MLEIGWKNCACSWETRHSLEIDSFSSDWCGSFSDLHRKQKLQDGSFTFPNHIRSWRCKEDLRHMLSLLLSPNPEDRPSIKDIKAHPIYMNETYVSLFARSITPGKGKRTKERVCVKRKSMGLTDNNRQQWFCSHFVSKYCPPFPPLPPSPAMHYHSFLALNRGFFPRGQIESMAWAWVTEWSNGKTSRRLSKCSVHWKNCETYA